MEMDVHEMLAMKAPITFEIACKAWGDDPNLCDDSTRKCFFAVWALLCFEWADAMVEHAQSRKVDADKTANFKNGKTRAASTGVAPWKCWKRGKRNDQTISDLS